MQRLIPVVGKSFVFSRHPELVEGLGSLDLWVPLDHAKGTAEN
jgi:hypothetical protein